MAAPGLARRIHPFTPFVAALAVTALAFLLPGPWRPPLLYAAVVVALLLLGQWRAIRGGLLISFVPWLFLLLLHGVLGDGPRLDGLPLSRAGLFTAVAMAGRFGAVATITVALMDAFDPSRFLDAVADRGWSFQAGYLLVATLQAVPRLGARARAIIEAQRARGLRHRGSPLGRLRALTPLAFPLMLGAVAELDERAMALESRGVERVLRRTPLDPPRIQAIDRIVMAAAMLAVIGALILAIYR